jgi:WD40-like Beta Propeller Repeat
MTRCILALTLGASLLGTTACESTPKYDITVVEPTAWASDWSHVTGQVVVNKPDSDGVYRLYLMNPDGSGEQPFASAHPALPQRTTGSGNWHPSGKYIVFVAEKAQHDGASSLATPGWGGYSDLWIATSDGASAWQLTDVPNDADHGTLIPIFSPDGTRLAWTERVGGVNLLDPLLQFGSWELKVADFVDGPSGPSLANIETITLDSPGFYETGGFSPDGGSLLFTSDATTGSVWDSQIFRVDLTTSHVVQLTTSGYNEHPRYTPAGQIMWMSNREATLGGTDWWQMNPDGSHQTRFSYFNEPFQPGCTGLPVWVGPVPPGNWSDDGSFFLGDVETNVATSAGQIRKVQLPQ